MAGASHHRAGVRAWRRVLGAALVGVIALVAAAAGGMATSHAAARPPRGASVPARAGGGPPRAAAGAWKEASGAARLSVMPGAGRAGRRAVTQKAPANAGAERRRGALRGDYGRLPLAFTANRGQADARARFLARGPGYSLFLTSPDAVLALAKPGGGEYGLRLHLRGARRVAAQGARRLPGVANFYLGADRKRWLEKVPTFGQVEYREVYAGVDLRYYGHQGRLESDFIVAPGGDAKRIAIVPEGALAARLSREGDLELALAGGVGKSRPASRRDRVILGHPRAYQMVRGARRPVAAAFRLAANGAVGFRVGPYDQRLPLVIDPPLTYTYAVSGGYSTLLGSGVSNDLGGQEQVGLVVDAAGEAILTGLTNAPSFPTDNAAQSSCPACADFGLNIFVAKLNTSGDGLVYATFLGGTRGEAAVFSAAAPGGGVLLSGQTQSTDFPNAILPATSSTGAFLAELSGSGALNFSGYIGYNGLEVEALASDAAGDAYIGGTTNSNEFSPVNGVETGCPDPRVGSCAIGFVEELSPGGGGLTTPFATMFGGSYNTEVRALAVDGVGNIYLGGYTTSGDLPTVNAYQTTPCPLASAPYHECTQSGFVAGINPNGVGGSQVLFSTYLAGASAPSSEPSSAGTSSAVTAVAVDGAAPANVYAAGEAGIGLATTPAGSVFEPLEGGAQEFEQNSFVAKFSTADNGAAAATPTYVTYLGGASGREDSAYAIAADAAGDAWVAGQTSSGDFPVLNAPPGFTPCPIGPDLFSCSGGYVAELDGAGANLLFSTYLGGPGSFGNDSATGVATDAAGDVYVGGATASPSFPTFSAFQTSCALSSGACNNYSAFAVKLKPETAPATPSVALAVNGGAVPTGGVVFPATAENVSATEVLRITNSGTSGTLTMGAFATGGASNDFSAQSGGVTGCAGVSLAPSESCEITLSWEPRQLGLDVGGLEIFDNAANLPSPLFLKLSGLGISGAIAEISPEPAAFGEVTQGQTETQTVTVTNAGNVALNIGTIATTGSGDFKIVADGCSGTSVAAAYAASRSSCTVEVAYSPTAASGTTPQAATLLIPDNSLTQNSPPDDTVALSGTPEPTVPAIGSMPSAASGGLNFGEYAPGAPSAARTVEVQSVGTGSLQILGAATQAGATGGGEVSAPGDFAILVNGCAGQLLAPGGTCAIVVSFAPTQTPVSAETANLVVASSDPVNPNWAIPLTGTAGPALGPPASLPELVSADNESPTPNPAQDGSRSAAISAGGQFAAFAAQPEGIGQNLPGPAAGDYSSIGGLYYRATCNGQAASCDQSTQFIAYGPASGALANGGAACLNQQATYTQGATDPAISRDGRFVAFNDDACPEAGASGPAQPNPFVYLRDLKLGVTQAVTDAAGAPLAGAFAMSGDARYFLFTSAQESLAPGSEVYVLDTCQSDGASVCSAASLTLASANAAGAADPAGANSVPAFSANGRFVAFTSPAADAAGVPGWEANTAYGLDAVIVDGNGNLEYASTPGVSGASAPTWATSSEETTPDGAVVWTMADQQVFLRDTCLGGPSGCAQSTILISTPDQNGTIAIGGVSGFTSDLEGVATSDLSVSADGRYVAFTSNAPNLPQPASPTPNTYPQEVYLRDTCRANGAAVAGCGASGAANAGTTTLISLAAGGTTPAGDSFAPLITADGGPVIFFSEQPLNATAPPNAVYSYSGGTVTVVSQTASAGVVEAAMARAATLDPTGAFTAYVGPDDGCTGCGQVWLNATNVATIAANVTVALTTLTPAPATPAPGQTITWTLNIANTGASNAADAQISDGLPSSGSLASAVPSQGSCSAPVGGLLNCDLGPLNAGAVATLTLNWVAPTTPGASLTDAPTLSTGSQTDSAAQQSISDTVTVASPPVITGTAAGGLVSELYNNAIAVSGGIGKITLSLAGGSGPLPPGLALSGASLAGTPTQQGTYAVSLVATDAEGEASTATAMTIVIGCPAYQLTGFIGGGTAMAPATLIETQGVTIAPILWVTSTTDLNANLASFPVGESGALDGLAFASAQLGGTPTGAGTFPFSVNAQGGGCSPTNGALSYTLSVAAPQPIILPTIQETMGVNDAIGSPNTLISGTILPMIQETIRTSDAIRSPNTLTSGIILPTVNETIQTSDAIGSPNTLTSGFILPTVLESVSVGDAPAPQACAVVVNGQVTVTIVSQGFIRGGYQRTYRVTAASAIAGPIDLMVASANAVTNDSGTTQCMGPGTPYLQFAGGLAAGQSQSFVVDFSETGFRPPLASASVLSGATP